MTKSLPDAESRVRDHERKAGDPHQRAIGAVQQAGWAPASRATHSAPMNG